MGVSRVVVEWSCDTKSCDSTTNVIADNLRLAMSAFPPNWGIRKKNIIVIKNGKSHQKTEAFCPTCVAVIAKSGVPVIRR